MAALSLFFAASIAQAAPSPQNASPGAESDASPATQSRYGGTNEDATSSASAEDSGYGEDADEREITVHVDPVHDYRDASAVDRRTMQTRLPRSAPDALRYEPGVFVQQSGHGQASPYVRGLTGQQTLIAFDGIRLNNATFRQGPNQYFFTVDSRTIAHLEVVRGSASTRWGSDALGGALLTTPLEPNLGRPAPRRSSDGDGDGNRYGGEDAVAEGRRPTGWVVHPRLAMTARTADGEAGARAQVDLGWGGKIGLLTGVGYRVVGPLRTGGPVLSPATGEPWREPRFDSDQRTQLGTGFRELSADTRLVWQFNPRMRLTAAYYDYRQKDAPRTDKCPPAEAPESECLRYLDQFRTLTYLAFDSERGPAPMERARVSVSYQRQHERTQLLRDNGIPEIDGGTESNGRDRVHTLGLRATASTASWSIGDSGVSTVGVDYGADLYFDQLESLAWLRFTDVDPVITDVLSRGQYVDGSRYLSSGAWVEPYVWAGPRVRVRAGGRAALVHADSPGDEDSGTRVIERTWGAVVGNAGLMVLATEWLSWHLDFDQGFRAPNLDDLTSRQQTGPGFQYENADLEPERSLSLDTGFRVRHERVEASLFAWHAFIRQLIGRAPREIDDCPDDGVTNPTGCGASRTRFQLVNLDGWALLRGVDASVRVFLPLGLAVRTTASWTWGEGPNPVPPPEAGTTSNYQARLPLSRIPPLNGTVELMWNHRTGVWLGSALRWATAQTRLALADESDTRIPLGGTPGYAVWDLRAGYRFDPNVLVSAVFENVLDAAYRYHGSSVNGATRSLNLNLELGF